MKPVEIEYLIKNGTKATIEQIISDLEKVGREGSASVDATSAAFEESQQKVLVLTNLVSKLEDEIKRLSATPSDIDQSKNIEQVQVLQSKIEELKLHIKQLEEVTETTEVVPPSLPTAKRQFDGLHFSIQQMAREMPTLAMGPQMFFLAISNNLPIFSDELARAKKEYAALTAAGEKGTPVWKQVVKSIFSWQTAMTTGIMLLVMYGDEIIQSITDMIGWKSAKQQMREEIEKSIEIEKEANEVAAKTRIELLRSINSIRNFSGTKEEERQKIDELNNKYGESFGYYQTLDEWYDTLIEKAEAYTRVMFLQAKQQSLLSKAIEADLKVEDTKKTRAEDVDGSMGWFKKAMMYNAQRQSHGTFDAQATIDEYNTTNKADVIAKAEEERDAYLAEMESLYKDEIDLAKNNNLNDVVAGSVADLENSIAIRRKALNDLTDPTEYKNRLSEIEELEARVRSITGAEDSNSKEYVNEQKRLADERARLETQTAKEQAVLILENKQAEIDLMADGSDKKIAQIKLNYTKEIAEIAAQEAKWKKAQNGKLTEDQTTEINKSKQIADDALKQDLKAEAEAEIKIQRDKNTELRREFETYEQERERIAKEYKKKIAAMYVDKEQTTLKVEFDQGNVDKAISEMNSKLTSLDISGLQLLKIAMGDVSKMPKDALTTSLNTLRDALGEATDPEQIKLFRDQIIAIEEAMTKDFSSGFTTDIESVIRGYKTVLEYDKKISAAKKEGSGATEEEVALYESYRAKALEDVKSGLFGAGITTFVSGLQQAAELMQKVADISGDTQLAEMGEQLSAITQNFSAAAQGAASGGWIGAIVGGVTDMISQTIEAFATAALEAAEAEANALAFANALELIKLTINEDDYDTIFGTTSIAKATDSYATAQEALAKYNEVVNASAEAFDGAKKSFDSLGFAIFTGGLWGWGKSASSEYLAYIDAMEKGYNDLQSMLIKTTDYSGWANFWGKDDKYTALADLAPEIWEDGVFNVENAQAFLDTNTQISDSQRKQIDNVIDLYEAYEEAKAIVDDYATELFGDIASDLTDAIWDSIIEGTDAWDSFYDIGSEVITSLGKQMIQEMIISEYLENYRDQISEAFATEDPATTLASITNDIIGGMGTVIEGTTAAAQAWIDGMEAWGYNVTSSTTQSGNIGSFETMTQDQGTKLEGLFTASEMRIARVEDGIESVSTQMTTAVSHLAKIEEYTGNSASLLKNLVDCVEQIIRDGLNIK